MKHINEQVESQRFIKNMSGKTKFIVSRNSRDIGLSRQTYQNKLDGMRDQKIITNFTININPNIRPNNLKYVMLEIKTNPKEPDLVKELLEIPQIRMLDGIIGDFSLFALFIFKSPEEYYQILNTIDKIMAKSHFKKYQIIETIKVFKTNGISMKDSAVSFDIDDVDYKILSILRDGQGAKPISTYEISKIFKEQLKIEISQSTIHNRIKKLEEQGVILNYTINFNPKKIGFKGKYLLRIKPKDPSKYNDLAIKLDIYRNITDLFRIGEQYGLFAIVRVKDIEDYATFIRDLYNSENIEDTYTNFVLDELISHTNFIISKSFSPTNVLNQEYFS
ncbi:MAG: Lrp/AsnC family transcriptional regulator [Candidatus Lokiarchaeota archaeon]|nr:Lrp/AsnC family transcriptional regulator [Candidatus Lokiarchaeota archaeon]